MGGSVSGGVRGFLKCLKVNKHVLSCDGILVGLRFGRSVKKYKKARNVGGVAAFMGLGGCHGDCI